MPPPYPDIALDSLGMPWAVCDDRIPMACCAGDEHYGLAMAVDGHGEDGLRRGGVLDGAVSGRKGAEVVPAVCG